MKTLYIECNMGCAGDMLMGALMEIAPEDAVRQLLELQVPEAHIHAHREQKCGITGTHVHVHAHGVEEGHEHEHHEHHHHDHVHAHEHHHHNHPGHSHEHHHYGMAEIETIIRGLPVSDNVKENALGVYKRIAAAESKVHGTSVEEVHFHEVGALDAVIDVVGNCLLMEAIAPERILASPVNVGSGSVECAHGILPVPAPATAEILTGVPCYSDEIQSELCTPTGAALLTHFAEDFTGRPLMRVEKTGIGLGTKDFPKANIVRVFLGEEGMTGGADSPEDRVSELSANIDDMTGEELGFAMEQLLEAGALDVYYTPIIMKKSRPAVKLSVLCSPVEADRMAHVIFKYTKTAGIRRADYSRYILDRSVETDNGIRIKTYSGHGVQRSKPEYEDVARKARDNGTSLWE